MQMRNQRWALFFFFALCTLHLHFAAQKNFKQQQQSDPARNGTFKLLTANVSFQCLDCKLQTTKCKFFGSVAKFKPQNSRNLQTKFKAQKQNNKFPDQQSYAYLISISKRTIDRFQPLAWLITFGCVIVIANPWIPII